ncbi:WD40 repeat-like protein [Russula earlei]|uniref:WD40 repeat-like protein n=1 Tax=Russula earlei TaxID=71964 RepID=A0ACC0TS65_9AGAM|nr:WD40 repeat-like protein [Russula earlei]
MLPPSLISHILGFLPFDCVTRASLVSKSWRDVIETDPVLWCKLLRSAELWFGGDSETAFVDALISRQRRKNRKDGCSRGGTRDPPLPNPYKVLFKSRHLTRTRWIDNPRPKHLSVPVHAAAAAAGAASSSSPSSSSIVTALLLSRGRIISASDGPSIDVHSPATGHLLRSLSGHKGGVWALATTGDTLVSGSTDRTVRVWDIPAGRCTHVFGGHTSTVRCLAIVKPEWVEVDVDPDDGDDGRGNVRMEKWPKRPLIVTGSRDRSLRVWHLPRPGDPDEANFDPEDGWVISQVDVDKNPYHKLHLEGHQQAVRALAARGRTLVSGSYDSTVRVWDIITGTCRWVLEGHSNKVYSVVLDSARRRVCSGSLDYTVRVWNLRTGECQYTLTGHASLVGLLGLSPSHLVSAGADATLRVWDPETGEPRHVLDAGTGAVNCFQHDEFKIVGASDGALKAWDVRSGATIRGSFFEDADGGRDVWHVLSEGRWCVAASSDRSSGATVLDVWDFGDGEPDDGWIGEPVGGIYDEDATDDEDEEGEVGGGGGGEGKEGEEGEEEEEEEDAVMVVSADARVTDPGQDGDEPPNGTDTANGGTSTSVDGADAEEEGFVIVGHVA